MENAFLIAGLGNPGAEYANTRHNAGFMLVEKLAAQWKSAWANERKFRASMAVGAFNGKRVFLCEPRTFMNASGEAVGAVMEFYQLAPDRLMIVSDDADLPVGTLRLRAGGSSGGHHGLESIESRLASRDFARLKIGIGRKDGLREITGHVLGRFDTAERELLEKVLDRARAQVELWLDGGIEKAMQLNGNVEALKG